MSRLSKDRPWRTSEAYWLRCSRRAEVHAELSTHNYASDMWQYINSQQPSAPLHKEMPTTNLQSSHRHRARCSATYHIPSGFMSKAPQPSQKHILVSPSITHVVHCTDRRTNAFKMFQTPMRVWHLQRTRDRIKEHHLHYARGIFCPVFAIQSQANTLSYGTCLYYHVHKTASEAMNTPAKPR